MSADTNGIMGQLILRLAAEDPHALNQWLSDLLPDLLLSLKFEVLCFCDRRNLEDLDSLLSFIRCAESDLAILREAMAKSVTSEPG